MCLIVLAWKESARYPLIVAANRDEAHDRPSLPVHEWPDAPGVYGGRDLREGGSWMAVAAGVRLAAVTNVRGAERPAGVRSRGHLVRDFVLQGGGAAGAARALAAGGPEFGPFNLLLCDGRELVHMSNRPTRAWQALAPGIHGVSNGGLNAAWPKVVRLTARMREFVDQLEGAALPDHELLFGALADTGVAADHELPETGVELEIERRLSPPFVLGDNYGTRASTVAVFAADGSIQLTERNFDAAGAPVEDRRINVPG
jgi:uncharacterized protein with NRDE domain